MFGLISPDGSNSISTPQFSPSGGTYSSAQTISISTSTTGATIHYTTDGTTPAESSATYNAPISISSTTTVKAGAWKPGLTPSSIATATYTIYTPVPASITISPSSSSISIGNDQTFTATTKDQFDNSISASISWTSSNTTVGTITSSGVFSALAEGYATITASSGSATGTASMTVSASLSPGSNLISNPGFESGTASWDFYTGGTGTFTAVPPSYSGTNSAKITLASTSTNIQFYQQGITLEPNTNYRLTFSAYSSTGHDLTVNLLKHVSPYTNYGLSYTPDIGTAWQIFTTDFTTSGFTGTVTDGRLMFWFADSAASGDIYYIDEVKIEKVDITPPSPINNLATSNPTSSSITLSWTAPGNDGSTGTASSYDIRYSTSLIAAASWASATTVTGEPTPLAAGTSQSFIVNGLNYGTTYYFAIKASDAAGNIGGLSNSPNGATLAVAPSAPQNLLAASGNNNITLTWQAPANNGGSSITNYRIYRSTTSGTESFISEVGNILTYTDTGLTNGQIYYYKVSAKNSAGEGPLSNEQSSTPQTIADNNPAISITNPSDGATLSGTSTIQATASDDKGISKVEFFIDSISKSNDTTFPYTYLWNTSKYLNGAHTIKAVAYDTILQENITQISVVIKNNNPPSLSWTGESNYINDGLNPGSGDTSSQYVYRIKYSDPDSDAPQTSYPKIHILKGGSEITSSPFTMSYISGPYLSGAIYSYTTPLPAGTYTYYFETQDTGGATPVTTGILSGPAVNSLLTPTVNSTTPPSGSTNIKYTAPISITFIEAMDRTATLSAVSISPSVSWTSSWNAASTILTLTPTSSLQKNTLYTITISTGAKSQTGVNFASQYQFSFTTSPQMTITVLSPQDQLYNRLLANITLSQPAQYCGYYLNSGSYQSLSGAPSLTAWSSISNPPEGINNISFECYDTAGNTWTTQSYSFHIDTTKPTLTSPPQTTTISSAFIQMTSSEALKTATLEFSGSNLTMSGTGANWYASIGSLANGNYTYKLYGTDMADNIDSIDSWVYINKTITTYSKINFTIKDNANNAITDGMIRLYNITGDIQNTALNATSRQASITMETGTIYSVAFSSLSGETLELKDVIATGNTTISPQFIATSSMPPQVEAHSHIIALKDTEISGYSYAKISLPINGTVNRILHCTNWDFTLAKCNSWNINQTSDYNAFVNSTRIIFNVAGFDAYTAGFYTAPPYCGNGIVDTGETCDTCPADAGVCYTQPATHSSGNRGIDEGSVTESSEVYTTSAKITLYPKELNVSAGRSIVIPIVVRNTGNTSISNLFIEMSTAWFKYDHKRISLDKNGFKTIKLTISVPNSTTPGIYRITLMLKGDAEDSASFNLIVPVNEGTAIAQLFDTEIIRKSIENIKERIHKAKDNGYNVTIAENYALKADESFAKAEYDAVSSYIRLAADNLDALDKNVQTQEITKTFLASYILVGMTVAGLMVAYYFLRKRWKAQSVKDGTPIVNNAAQNNSEWDHDVNFSDLAKRIEEIKKHISDGNG